MLIPDGYVTPQQAAQMVRVDPKTIYRYIWAGKLKTAYKNSSGWLLIQAQEILEVFRREYPPGAPEPPSDELQVRVRAWNEARDREVEMAAEFYAPQLRSSLSARAAADMRKVWARKEIERAYSLGMMRERLRRDGWPRWKE